MLGEGCGCAPDVSTLVPTLTPAAAVTASATPLGKVNLSPLAATCIDVYEDCQGQPVENQERCVDEWWLTDMLWRVREVRTVEVSLAVWHMLGRAMLPVEAHRLLHGSRRPAMSGE